MEIEGDFYVKISYMDVSVIELMSDGVKYSMDEHGERYVQIDSFIEWLQSQGELSRMRSKILDFCLEARERIEKGDIERY